MGDNTDLIKSILRRAFKPDLPRFLSKMSTCLTTTTNLSSFGSDGAIAKAAPLSKAVVERVNNVMSRAPSINIQQ